MSKHIQEWIGLLRKVANQEDPTLVIILSILTCIDIEMSLLEAQASSIIKHLEVEDE